MAETSVIFYKAKIVLTDGTLLVSEGRDAFALIQELNRAHSTRLISLEVRKYERLPDGTVRGIRFD